MSVTEFDAESAAERSRRAGRINQTLSVLYTDARTELNHTSALELAVATILSARSTDKKINEVTPELFRKYPDAAAYAAADRDALAVMIHSTGFFRNKTDTLIKLGRELTERYDGQLPHDMAQLVGLPGFGRKTASVVLGNAFGIPAIAVDTHVSRLASRWSLTTSTNPVKVEADLAAVVQRDEWTKFTNRVTWHGRRMCHAKVPACGVCPVAPLCPSRGIGEVDATRAASLVDEDVLDRAGVRLDD
jgi:endonuclease-3